MGRKFMKGITGIISAGIVSIATVSSIQHIAGQFELHQTLAALGSMLTAPAAATGALGQIVQQQSQEPSSQEESQDSELDSEFWTEFPKANEILPTPAPPVAESQPESTQNPEPINTVAPEGTLPIQEAHYEQGQGARYVSCGAATIKNNTKLSSEEIAQQVGQPLPFSIEKNSSQPQVLIMHTHATETYQLDENLWYNPSFNARSTDTTVNMATVGAEIVAQLNAAGINTVQDITLHDYPSYTGAYERSNATVKRWLAEYPSIKVVLDVHRDAIEYKNGTRVKPVSEIDGMKAAQVMIICGADKNGNLPNFKENLKFAAAWQNKMESMFPGLTRPVLFDYRYYNQDLTTGSLLIEMGGHANTVEEAKYSGKLVGQALAALLNES